MIEEFAKEYLHNDLRQVRAAMLAKLDGLSEYDVRRPLTSTGTNPLGLIKHLSVGEAWYFGETFGRPFPGEWLAEAMDAGPLDSMWVKPTESRSDIVDRYNTASEHADTTIEQLEITALGHVPWWPRPNVKLFNVMVHMLTETNRHAGHADILREQLDGGFGNNPSSSTHNETLVTFWQRHRSQVEQAAIDADRPRT